VLPAPCLEPAELEAICIETFYELLCARMRTRANILSVAVSNYNDSSEAGNFVSLFAGHGHVKIITSLADASNHLAVAARKEQPS
jgi:hypothetical protein